MAQLTSPSVSPTGSGTVSRPTIDRSLLSFDSSMLYQYHRRASTQLEVPAPNTDNFIVCSGWTYLSLLWTIKNIVDFCKHFDKLLNNSVTGTKAWIHSRMTETTVTPSYYSQHAP